MSVRRSRPHVLAIDRRALTVSVAGDRDAPSGIALRQAPGRERVPRLGVARRVRAGLRPRIDLPDRPRRRPHRRRSAARLHQQPGVRPLADVAAVPELRGRGCRLADAADVLVDAAAEVAREQRCRHVELRHVARRFPALPCKAAQGRDAAAARHGDVGAARSQGPQPDSQGAEIRVDERVRRRRAARRFLQRVRAKHARPRHARSTHVACSRRCWRPFPRGRRFTSSG